MTVAEGIERLVFKSASGGDRGPRRLDQLGQSRVRLLETGQAPEQFAGDPEVVGSEVGSMVEDRDGALGRFGVGDGGAHDGVED